MKRLTKHFIDESIKVVNESYGAALVLHHQLDRWGLDRRNGPGLSTVMRGSLREVYSYLVGYRDAALYARGQVPIGQG